MDTHISKILGVLLPGLAILIGSTIVFAQTNPSTKANAGTAEAASTSLSAGSSKSIVSNHDAIAPGTRITMENWRQYKEFMPDGMVSLFEGKYFWKMPPDVAIEVGPTIIHPLPKNYLEATEKHSGQVKIVELPDGGLNLAGYQGGLPFPSPADPHKGWKILANLWFRYIPHISVDPSGAGCEVDHYGSINCEAAEIVYRQLSYNTDPGVPATIPGAEGKYFTEYLEIVEPEQQRYNASLKISWTDLSRTEDGYIFLPSLRRAQAVSALARCSPSQGTDSTPEDLRGGYDSNMTQVKVDFLAEKKILTLQGFKMPTGVFPQNFDMPLGWPMPSWGQWQVRDVYVIGVSKLPSRAAGYCYGKRVMYIDKQFYGLLWEEMTDAKDQPWKILAVFRPRAEAPGIGPVNDALSYVEAIWDVQNQHATFFEDPSNGHPLYVNEQTPASLQDLTRYTTPSGLTMIMR